MKVAQIPTDTLGEILDGIVRFLPNLLAVAGLLVAGWVAGRILKALTVRLLGVWALESPAAWAGFCAAVTWSAGSGPAPADQLPMPSVA